MANINSILMAGAAEKISSLRQKGADLVAKYADFLNEFSAKMDAHPDYYPEFDEPSEQLAADFEAFALECIEDYPVPSEDGPAREMALADRQTLVRDIGGELGFGPLDGEAWLGMDKNVGYELGWW